MATASRRNDMLPVQAHRHHRGITMETATRARRQQDTTNTMDSSRLDYVQTDVQDTTPPTKTPQDISQPAEKSPRQTLGATDGEIAGAKLPGVNQVDPGRIYNPMPGKNQPKPSIDAAAAAALLSPLSQTSTLCKTVTTYLTMTRTGADSASKTSDSGANAGFSWPTPSASSVSAGVSSAPSLPPLASFSTFVLFSRSEDFKEQVTTSSRSINTPLAITASSTLTALSVPTLRPTPSNVASSAVNGSSTGLSPLSRSLFVLFGVLGAITMLIAVAVFYVARRNRKRQERANRYIEDVPFDGNKVVYEYGDKARMSADTMHGIPPDLTESERNIVRRAATQDGQPEVHITAPGARLHDAINSFIAKSRRLTYKISP